ncbi:MAG TPA: hypothetical protein VGP76_11475 [Planctomycetaceae bacterium]|nr:hypothetical protein [Planctomycetaceae bacterium]
MNRKHKSAWTRIGIAMLTILGGSVVTRTLFDGHSLWVSCSIGLVTAAVVFTIGWVIARRFGIDTING